MTLALGTQHIAAQLAASLAFADDAPGPSVIRLYTTTQPATGAAPGGAAQAEITLAKPCATLAAGVLTLHVADPAGALVLASGLPRWARWARSDGLLVADGTVTDMDHGGDFKLQGGTTPVGETSPQLQAGGVVLLGAVEMA